MEEFEEEYSFSESQEHYLNQFKLPEIVYSIVEKTDDPFDSLIRFSRLDSDEFYSKNSEIQSIIWNQISILSVIIYNQSLDTEYFSSLPLNKEKIKFIIGCLVSTISVLSKKIDQNETEDSDSHFVLQNLKGIVYNLWKYDRALKLEFTLTEEEIEKLNPTKVDGRISPKAPTNISRIKSLKEYCPELWNKLSKSQSKELQIKIIHAITGANKEDSYKYSFGTRQKELKSYIIEDFEQLNSTLNK